MACPMACRMHSNGSDGMPNGPDAQGTITSYITKSYRCLWLEWHAQWNGCFFVPFRANFLILCPMAGCFFSHFIWPCQMDDWAGWHAPQWMPDDMPNWPDGMLNKRPMGRMFFAHFDHNTECQPSYNNLTICNNMYN